jgi:hypothetical protein
MTRSWFWVFYLYKSFKGGDADSVEISHQSLYPPANAGMNFKNYFGGARI